MHLKLYLEKHSLHQNSASYVFSYTDTQKLTLSYQCKKMNFLMMAGKSGMHISNC